MGTSQAVIIKRERARKANELIDTIAFCGRRFFNHRYGVSHFRVDVRGRVWFWDGFTAALIYVAYKHWSKGFSQGGTLRDLVNALRDYIRTGEPLGAWRFDYDKNYWGYGDDMGIVQAKAIELGIARTAEA
jgi:hypothetical protein